MVMVRGGGVGGVLLFVWCSCGVTLLLTVVSLLSTEGGMSCVFELSTVMDGSTVSELLTVFLEVGVAFVVLSVTFPEE